MNISKKTLLIGTLTTVLIAGGASAGTTAYLMNKEFSKEPVAITVKKNSTQNKDKEDSKTEAKKTDTKSQEGTNKSTPTPTPDVSATMSYPETLASITDDETLEAMKQQAIDTCESKSKYYKNGTYLGSVLEVRKDGVVDQTTPSNLFYIVVTMQDTNTDTVLYDYIYYKDVKIDKDGKLANVNPMIYEKNSYSVQYTLGSAKEEIEDDDKEYYTFEYSDALQE